MDQTDAVVYVVDDDPALREVLTRLIRSAGYEVKAFPSADAFLQFNPPDTPSCLLLDVKMPQMTGLELQQEMAARRIHLPIVFISGYGDIPMAVKAIQDGAVDFLPKPFQGPELMDIIAKALARDRAERRQRAEREEIERRFASLTPREKEVLALVVTGLLNKQIGGRLGVSEKTVKVHRGRVMKKMQADSLADLVRMAAKLGLGNPGQARKNSASG